MNHPATNPEDDSRFIDYEADEDEGNQSYIGGEMRNLDQPIGLTSIDEMRSLDQPIRLTSEHQTRNLDQPIRLASEIRVPCDETEGIRRVPAPIYVSRLQARTWSKWEPQQWREFEVFIDATNAERLNHNMQPMTMKEVMVYMHKDMVNHTREYLISIQHRNRFDWVYELSWDDFKKVISMFFTGARKIHQDREKEDIMSRLTELKLQFRLEGGIPTIFPYTKAVDDIAQIARDVLDKEDEEKAVKCLLDNLPKGKFGNQLRNVLKSTYMQPTTLNDYMDVLPAALGHIISCVEDLEGYGYQVMHIDHDINQNPKNLKKRDHQQSREAKQNPQTTSAQTTTLLPCTACGKGFHDKTRCGFVEKGHPDINTDDNCAFVDSPIGKRYQRERERQ